MFYFYALPAQPFLALAAAYVLGAMIGSTPSDGPARAAQGGVGHPTRTGVDRRLVGSVLAGVYLLLVAACFAYFWPIYVGEPLPYQEWLARRWLGGRWV
jgi:dolichyl-phosphate-mannose--protein O-mannosyl transferase